MASNRFLVTLVMYTLVYSASTCDAARKKPRKIDCHPLTGGAQDYCESMGCIWSPVEPEENPPKSYGQPVGYDVEYNAGVSDYAIMLGEQIREPYCSFPEHYEGYKIVNQVSNHGNHIFYLKRSKPSGLLEDISEITVNIIYSSEAVMRLIIQDTNNQRFETPLPIISTTPPAKAPGDKLKYHIVNGESLQIVRKSTGAVLLDLDLNRMFFTDQFIQVNSKLSSPFVYGLGEHYGPFLKMADSYKSYSFHATDRMIMPGGTRAYGSFPFYINLDSNNKFAFGVLLNNVNAKDIILQNDQSITYRTTGGILDFLIYSGPKPMDVIVQYQNSVGLPSLPPRWSLGFHLSRYNYMTLEKVEQVWNRTVDAGIPYDVQWIDIDYMENGNGFTYDKKRYNGLPEFIDRLHKINMRLVPVFDPGLNLDIDQEPYKMAIKEDILIKNATNQDLVGKVWNGSGKTVFPDFSHPRAMKFWTELFKEFYEKLKFDGAWLDMNEPSNFVEGSADGCPADDKLENPPYLPAGISLNYYSVCSTALMKAGKAYNVRNLYAFYESIATTKALETVRPGKRPFIISRATVPGQGKYVGHWSGDILASWDYLRWSIPSLIEHSMYGFPIMGSDICGFFGNTTVELCARWSTLGAFYTFARNHNDGTPVDQDPVILGPVVVEANVNALTKRYSLLPYLYTLMHKAHRFGESVVRSVPFEFYQTDPEALKVEHQFMWGEALMISPVVYSKTFFKTTFLPRGRWYETDVKLTADQTEKVPKIIDSTGEWHLTDDIALIDIPLFYRGGYILPFYSKPEKTVDEIVQQPIGLEVALDYKFQANGEIYLDDGDNVNGRHDYLTFEMKDRQLIIKTVHAKYSGSTQLGQIRVYGAPEKVSHVRANGKSIRFERIDHMIYFDLEGQSVTEDNIFMIEFKK